MSERKEIEWERDMRDIDERERERDGVKTRDKIEENGTEKKGKEGDTRGREQ